MRHRFKQPFSERDAFAAITDTLVVLDELLGPLSGAATRPRGVGILKVYAGLLEGVDEARERRDMLGVYSVCRRARGMALDVLYSVEEQAVGEVGGKAWL